MPLHHDRCGPGQDGRGGGASDPARPHQGGTARLVRLLAGAALVLGALPACGGLAAARAQTSASVVRLGDLAFGRVVAGVGAQISPSEPGAGRFRIDAPAGSTLTVAYTGI